VTGPIIKVEIIQLTEDQELEIQTPEPVDPAYLPTSPSYLPDPEAPGFNHMTPPLTIGPDPVILVNHKSCIGCNLQCVTEELEWCLGCKINCPYHLFSYVRNPPIWASLDKQDSSVLTFPSADKVGPVTPPSDPFLLREKAQFETFQQIRQHLRKQTHPRRLCLPVQHHEPTDPLLLTLSSTRTSSPQLSLKQELDPK